MMSAALEPYRKKRDFKATSEPEGGASTGQGHGFVIQKHDATRLHYDFRLEMDGVLKSWAVAKGPSLLPGEKRLAVHVEDHPLEYGDFEGTIPKGEYGGGTVIVWDRGTWTPIHDAAKGYAKGHLEFELQGEKLSGHWHLVRMHGKPGERRENWLLIKGEDAAARQAGDPDILEERPESVKTGRMIADVADEAPGWSSKTGRIPKAGKASAAPKAVRGAGRKPKAKKVEAPEAPTGETPDIGLDASEIEGATAEALPDFIEPSLATLTARPPSGRRWLHEIKFDGYRLQARIEAGRVRLLTRSGLDWTKKFGKPVVEAFQRLPVGTAIIDGELVVETGAGASDFSALQVDLSEGRADRFSFYAFDLLHLDGHDLRQVPLMRRKETLEEILGTDGGLLRYSGHFDEDGALVLQHACRLGLEGVVSKVRDAPYQSGRGKTWVKAKCSSRQEFVVGGYVPSTTSKNTVGSLLLGLYDDGRLDYVGRVGTGFSDAVAQDLLKRLTRLKSDASPFAGKLTADEARLARYVRPELVAEAEFRAWTADGRLRHASFRGLREDKPASEIVREGPKAKAKAGAKAPAPPKTAVKLTHGDRVYWPDTGVTKEGLADYYSEVWQWMAPYVTGRPLALLRCPDGIAGPSFFQKHAWKGLRSSILLVKDPAQEAEEAFVAVNDLDGLIGLVQGAVLEIHPWGSTLEDWERPDTITMDLDPGEGVGWTEIIAAAEEVRERLKLAGLEPFVKTSGGKGLHVVAPVRPSADWPAVKAFTKAMADAMAGDTPDRYVSTITKSKRRGKVLIDYLRNQRGMTAVAPYSTRARPGAPVSMPLDWSELSPAIGPSYFTVENAPTRMAALNADPWDGFRSAAAPLDVDQPKRRSRR